jgi:hypothetical protein
MNWLDHNKPSHVRVVELLDAQTAAILGRATADLAHRPSGLTEEESQEVAELLTLTRRLSESLQPVAPSEDFVVRLKAEITGEATPTLMLRWRKLPASYRVAARLGGITLTAGLALLATRRVFGLVAALQAAREATRLSGRKPAEGLLNTMS